MRLICRAQHVWCWNIYHLLGKKTLRIITQISEQPGWFWVIRSVWKRSLYNLIIRHSNIVEGKILQPIDGFASAGGGYRSGIRRAELEHILLIQANRDASRYLGSGLGHRFPTVVS